MIRSRSVVRAGLALSLTVVTAAVAATAATERTADEAVAAWANEVWSSARAGDTIQLERTLAEIPRDAAAEGRSAKAYERFSTNLERLVEHRAAAAEARDEQRDAALERMRTELGDGSSAKALREAVIAQSHTADYSAFLDNDEVMSLVRWAEERVPIEESDRRWIDAQELLYLLRTFYEDTDRQDAFQRHDDELGVVNRRVELLARYAPKVLHEMRSARADRLGEEPYAEFNPAQVIDYRERLDRIDRRMVFSMLGAAADGHIEAKGWEPLLEGGLDSLRTLATTQPLKTEFARLGDAAAVNAWVDAVDAWTDRVQEARPRDLSQRTAVVMIDDLLALNDDTVRLPEAVVLREFGDGAMNRLDTYSDIVWPDELRRFRQQTEGDFVGVGILIRHNDKREIQVVNPLEGTPAYRAGVLPDDTIATVDGDSTVGWTLNDAVDRITGPRGSVVRLGIVREGVEEPLQIRIERNVIKIHSVKGWEKTGVEDDGEPIWNWMIDDAAGIAYLRLTQFTNASHGDLLNAWREILEQNGGAPNGLILDLRHNPGGLLTAAVSISNLFVPRGEIVTGEDRNGQRVWRQPALSHHALFDRAGVSTVVLINKGSASASEIVAGALQAHGKALVVGERSFGKGSVQTVHQVSREGRLKLTTQYYRLPSPDGGQTPGRLVHKRPGEDVWGVDPNVEVVMTAQQAADALSLRQRAEMAFMPGIEALEEAEGLEPADIGDLLSEGIDPQLQTALLVLQAQALSKLEAIDGVRHARRDG